MSQATVCLGFFLALLPRNALHSMHTRSLKLQPSSSSSAKGLTGKHEEHARKHEDLLALWVAFKAEAMHQPTSSTLSMFQSLRKPWPVLLKNLVGKESRDQWQEKSLASSFAADLHELSRWPQHYENDVAAWSFQTLAFAMIWNCWKRAPLLKCSDTVCLSIIKTSKRSGTSETCTTCMSLRGLTFHDPGQRWNHQSSTYLSSTLALNFPQYYPIVCISAAFSNIHAVYEITDTPMSWATLLPSQLKLTKATRGRLSLIRIEYHKEQICRCGRCAWLVWGICMVPRVPTAGRCPKILFRIVTRSLACLCRALGCCIRRLTTQAISAFFCPCPKILYAWDSFWQFSLATHCTACTQDHWSCNPHQAAPQKDLQGNMRNMQGRMRICWLFGLPSKQKLCTNQPHLLCPCSNLSACCDPFSSKTLSVKSQGTNGKKSHLLHLLLRIYMNCQDDHNTMRTM